ncbi:MAG TPA: hypothetical protein VNO82_06990 [Solirubrobacteraceae bacterium]|nr:hypothetical protein [Solirubrobacteraceae bacterium]
MAAIQEIRATIERCDERAARATLRAQIGRLEHEHATLVAAAYPRLDPGSPLPSLAGPRLLSLGDLERVRDALAGRNGALREATAEQEERQEAARAELERMLADPPAHRWHRLANADLGLPGCTTYHVRPRAGLLGMLMGWWEVKVSGGCPLPSPSARGRRGIHSRWSSCACSPASCCSFSGC